ncbi:MAG: CDP-glycerol glycerophosphotransferase family protein [Methanobacteriaceae archaeon]|nr:CDP-glycerol glycerophosphotransferase family protein [Methanobacteriaceae archaeon]
MNLKRIFKIINRIIPKRQDLVVFNSALDFTDNSMALFEYMDSLDEDFELVWIVKNPRDDLNIKQYKLNNLKALFKTFRAGYIISTHGNLLDVRVPSQVFVNVWHGMPLKAMGYAIKDADEHLPSFKDSNYYLIATSIIMRNALAACFNQDPRRIFITGQPRNDKLFKGCQKKILEILKINPSEYNKIILFAPTFRKSDFRDDGRLISCKFNLQDFDISHFQEFLRDHGILCLVKFHPLEEKEATGYFKGAENIKLINTRILQENLIDIYDILGCVDILITDYSSIYFDFLLLDRPIIFIVSDLEEYRERRGFILEPFEFWTPGPKVKNFKKFLEELEKSIKNPKYYQKERKVINGLVNYYKDDKSAERIYKLVFKD